MKIYYHYFCAERSDHIFKKTLEEILDSGLYTQEILNSENSKIIVNVVRLNSEEELQMLKMERQDFKKLEFRNYRSRSLKELHQPDPQNPGLKPNSHWLFQDF
jgi:hypothetical protein